MPPSVVRTWAFVLLLAGAAGPALAHPGHAAGGFASGFLHPLLGADHVVAMVAVGLWSAFSGRAALWVLPLAFLLAMVGGAALATAGVALPHVEAGIAVSVVALGALVAAAARLPVGIAAAVVATFAVFHGHAHGSELALAVDPLAVGMGFVAATALLHLAGIGLGQLARWPAGTIAVRAAGAAAAAAGGALLLAPLV